MIDTKELRRLAQAATPHVGHACKYQDAHWLREGHVDFENADLFIASERPQEDAAFYAAANPATVIELLDRLESAESDALEQARLNGMGASREAALMAKLEAAEKTKSDWLRANAPGGWIDALRLECDYLLARIEEMEQQEPYSYIYEYSNPIDGSPVWRDKPGYWNAQFPKSSKPLYLAPGAQPAPSFADAYQGAMEDVAIWKRRALEAEDLNRKFVAEINGPAYMGEPAQPAPSVPEGWKLVPIEPTYEMLEAGEGALVPTYTDTPVSVPFDVYRAMLAAAPEAKP